MYLGIDIGTSGVKAILMDEAGTVLEITSAPLSVSRPHELWSEQDPADWWAATNSAVATLIIDREYDERGTIGDDGAITLDPDGPVIAEELARRVVANGGRVLALSADRLPGGSPVTAVLRYPQ